MRHFRQIASGLNVEPLLQQIEQHSALWNSDDSWLKGKEGSPIYAADNIVLRYNKSSQPGLNDWDKPAFSLFSSAVDVVFDVMRSIPGEHLGKVMISRLRPGEKIDWHIDRWPSSLPIYFQRYQIPLQVAEGVRFVVEDEEVYMAPGTAWWFDNQKTHAVFNDSNRDRLSMFCDIRPFKLGMQS